jgi:hypothetical protein
MTNKRELSSDMNYEQVQVECYSGYRVNERPKVFTYKGRRLEILKIIDRWYEGNIDTSRPRIDYFKVRTLDEQVFLLRYLSLSDAWSVRV